MAAKTAKPIIWWAELKFFDCEEVRVAHYDFDNTMVSAYLVV